MRFHSNFSMRVKSYFSGRVCSVVVENFQSSPSLQTSGVSQGSVLCPLILALFENDISSCLVKSKFLLYVGDLNIFLKAATFRDDLDLQFGLNNLNE